MKVRLTLVPLTSPPCHVGEQLRDSTAVWHKPTSLFEITDGGIVIPKACVVILSNRQSRFAEIRLQGKRCFGCFPSLFSESSSRRKTDRQISSGIGVCEKRPGKGEVRIQTNRLLEIFLRAESISVGIS